MTLKAIRTDRAPGAIGPYSQAIVAGDLVYTAGQVPLDPTSGEVVGSTIEEQTARVLDSLGAILEAAGASLRTVIKTTVFLNDMAEFAAMNDVYARYFGDHKPARSTVQAARLPKDVKVEIEA
ncbi:MAG: RidA family protein, partial [Longimicrobiales bacterium]